MMKAHWNTLTYFESAAAADIAADLEAGADPTAMDTWGRTPWDRARHNNAIKGSDSLRHLRPDDRANRE